MSCVTTLSFLRRKGLSKVADTAAQVPLILGVPAVGCFAAPGWDFLRLGVGCWIFSTSIILGLSHGASLGVEHQQSHGTPWRGDVHQHGQTCVSCQKS